MSHPVPDEDHGHYMPEPVTLTASAELAAKMAEKRVVGASLRVEPLPDPGPEPWARAAWEADLPEVDPPAPVPATAHVMFHESKVHPGVVWPL